MFIKGFQPVLMVVCFGVSVWLIEASWSLQEKIPTQFFYEIIEINDIFHVSGGLFVWSRQVDVCETTAYTVEQKYGVLNFSILLFQHNDVCMSELYLVYSLTITASSIA